MGPVLEPTVTGMALAAVLVVAGAPLFSSGLRALRLRRSLARLEERPLGEAPTGLVWVRGRVALDSPLAGPLSGKPCAGFRVELRGPGRRLMAAIEERRSFRMVAGGVTARVLPTGATLEMRVQGERELSAREPLSQNLSALINRSPGAALLRRCGVSIAVTERALLAGQECFVIGQARHARPYEMPAELLATGTDGSPVAVSAAGPGGSWAGEPDLWIGADGHLDCLSIADRSPEPARLVPGVWRTLGVATGPLLSLTGLLYLARAADRLRAGGGF